MIKCIIIANGSSPSKNQITFFQKNGYNTLICADGGANSVAKLGLIPDYIIGDMDSILPATFKKFQDKCEIIQIKRQNDTDVEKCLKFAIKKKCDEVILLGATGDRLDHSFCNLGIVLKFFKQIKVKIVHGKSILEAITGNKLLETIPGETISLYGFDKKTKITSVGLKYPLKNSSLIFGIKESTSNRSIRKKIRLQVKGGKIFIIRDFETLRKNGLV